jgi:hypothetical protein
MDITNLGADSINKSTESIQDSSSGAVPTSALQVALEIFPVTLRQANEMIEKLHRHHKPVVGHRFSLGTRRKIDKVCVGVVVVGRPVAREVSQYEVAEVIRLVTNGTPNACSILYAAASRVCKEMGFEKIQTYILSSEPGTSLKAAGWHFEANTQGGDWNHSWRKGRRVDQPMISKQRWAREF